MKNIPKIKLSLARLFVIPLLFLGSVIAVPAIVSAQESCDRTRNAADLRQCMKDNPLVKRIQQVVDVLSIGVGIVVVGALIVGGIQYIIAGDNANAVSAAKSRVMNALLALAVFLFLWAFLQWLIPGGVFST